MAAPVGTVDWAIATLRLAAERAIGHGAPCSAVRYLSRAVIEAGENSPAHGDLLVALGRAQAAAEPAEAVVSLRAAFAGRPIRTAGRRSRGCWPARWPLRSTFGSGRCARARSDEIQPAPTAPRRSAGRLPRLRGVLPRPTATIDRTRYAAPARATGGRQSRGPDGACCAGDALRPVLGANQQTITLAERAWGDGALLQTTARTAPAG